MKTFTVSIKARHEMHRLKVDILKQYFTSTNISKESSIIKTVRVIVDGI